MAKCKAGCQCGRHKNGGWNRGKPWPEEVKERIRRGQHRAGCQCPFHTGRSNHKPDCKCPWHGGRGWPRGPRKSVEELLTQRQGRRGHGGPVLRRLIRDGVWPDQCGICGLHGEWNGLPLVLVLDHINGDAADWRLENLRPLCPNCNSQTETFAGRNARSASR